MPVQRFAPMTKNFATFDCDAHVTEPPLIWERAKDFLTRDELDALKQTIWWDAESRLLIVNGRAGVGLGSPRKGGIPGTMRVITNAGPGVKHDIQRALNVRNLNPKTALTQEQVAYLDHAGSYEPKPRLKDMDVQGIDQVMIIPTEIDIYPWLENALGAKAFCRAYNEWAYEYTLADPERLFFAALIPMQHPDYAVEEIHRVAALGCRVALVRPMDAMGNYPMQPKYEPVWDALEETGMVYGMHPFPAFGSSKPSGYSEQYSGAELIRRTVATAGLPHSFLTNVQNFQSEAALWVTVVLMSGFFDRHPKINAAVFEASSTWLSFLIDERQGLPPLPQRTAIAATEEAPERDLLRALHDRLRGRRGTAGAPAGVLRRYIVLVVGRLSPRRRRRLAGNGDDANTRAAEGGSGQILGRQRPAPLQRTGAGQHHPRARHRDRAPGLVADGGGSPRRAAARGGA